MQRYNNTQNSSNTCSTPNINHNTNYNTNHKINHMIDNKIKYKNYLWCKSCNQKHYLDDLQEKNIFYIEETPYYELVTYKCPNTEKVLDASISGETIN